MRRCKETDGENVQLTQTFGEMLAVFAVLALVDCRFLRSKAIPLGMMGTACALKNRVVNESNNCKVQWRGNVISRERGQSDSGQKAIRGEELMTSALPGPVAPRNKKRGEVVGGG